MGKRLPATRVDSPPGSAAFQRLTAMPEYPQLLQEIIESLDFAADQSERIEMLIEWADKYREVPPKIATRPFPESHRVPFCESEVFVWARPGADGGLKLYFAVDNPQGISAMALSAILQRALSGLPPVAILQVSPEIVYDIFGRNISMGKGQGLMGIVSMVHALARAAK